MVQQLERTQSPVKPRHLETTVSPGFYEQNTQQVRAKLRQFGFGPAVEFLTPEGLDKQAYLRFARTRLLGPDYADGVTKPLPEKVGEVTLPENVRQHIGNMSLHNFSMNVGYGHERPAVALVNTIQLLGGDVHDTFFGGPEDILPEKGVITDRTFRAGSHAYVEASLQTGKDQGILGEIPEVIDPDPEATKQIRLLSSLLKGKFGRKGADQAVKAIFTVEDTETPASMHFKANLLRPFFGKQMENLITNYQNKHPGKDSYVFSTWLIMAHFIGTLSNRLQQTFTSGHFPADYGMILGAYSTHIKTYTEAFDTIEKWSHRLGQEGKPLENAMVMDGYITPLAVFQREELTKKRQEALANGTPLTIIATASGVAPLQTEQFLQFITNSEQELRDGKIRMVVQCGAEEGRGHYVYNQLKQLVDEKGLEDQVVLHVAKDPQAAIDFFEMASWAETPTALLVKGSEMARIAHTLNVPLIPTGIVGNIEAWNIAATTIYSPEMIAFPSHVGPTYRENAEKILGNDVLMQHHPEYMTRLQENIKKRTAANTEELIDMVSAYILSGKMTDSSASGVLTILSDMIERKQKEKQRKKRRGK